MGKSSSVHSPHSQWMDTRNWSHSIGLDSWLDISDCVACATAEHRTREAMMGTPLLSSSPLGILRCSENGEMISSLTVSIFNFYLVDWCLMSSSRDCPFDSSHSPIVLRVLIAQRTIPTIGRGWAVDARDEIFTR